MQLHGVFENDRNQNFLLPIQPAQSMADFKSFAADHPHIRQHKMPLPALLAANAGLVVNTHLFFPRLGLEVPLQTPSGSDKRRKHHHRPLSSAGLERR